MPTIVLEKKQNIDKTAVAVESKLDALTSLRFFAAMMIFVSHTLQMFGFCGENETRVPALWQGVSFFFVLSGFILAHVYPSLEKSGAQERFLLARFARIWPTHVVGFFLTGLLVPPVLQIPNVFPIALANLSMVQAWSFNPAIINSFNAVSWTISVELFFYLSFPFLIKDFNLPKKLRWLAAASVSIACVALPISSYFITIPGCSFSGIDFINSNPLCRLLEFTIGIAVCKLFKTSSFSQSMSPIRASVLEVCTLLCIAGAISLPMIWPQESAHGPWSIVRLWAVNMGGAPLYAVLIFLMANPKGYIGKLLTKKLFVKLGEISFSLYMFHLSIIYAVLPFQEPFSNLPAFVLPAIAFVLSIVVAHLNYTFIETPFRSRIVSLNQPTLPKPKVDSTHKTYAQNQLVPLFSGLSLLLLLITWLNVQFRFIPNPIAERIVAHSIPNTRGIKFGDKFMLLGLKLSRKADGLHVNTVWKSLASQKLAYVNTIQLHDPSGIASCTKLRTQDNFHRSVSSGQIWEDQLLLKPKELKNALTLGLQLYDPSTRKPLPTNDGAVNGCLLVAIP